MWFEFPDGTDTINVQLQTFEVEFTDKEGRRYTRAPDHFAPLILDIPGFKSAQQPKGAPEDLPKTIPAEQLAFGQLGSQVDALKAELEGVRALLATTSAERDNLKLRVHELETDAANDKIDTATPVKK